MGTLCNWKQRKEPWRSKVLGNRALWFSWYQNSESDFLSDLQLSLHRSGDQCVASQRERNRLGIFSYRVPIWIVRRSCRLENPGTHRMLHGYQMSLDRLASTYIQEVLAVTRLWELFELSYWWLEAWKHREDQRTFQRHLEPRRRQSRGLGSNTKRYSKPFEVRYQTAERGRRAQFLRGRHPHYAHLLAFERGAHAISYHGTHCAPWGQSLYAPQRPHDRGSHLLWTWHILERVYRYKLIRFAWKSHLRALAANKERW